MNFVLSHTEIRRDFTVVFSWPILIDVCILRSLDLLPFGWTRGQWEWFHWWLHSTGGSTEGQILIVYAAILLRAFEQPTAWLGKPFPNVGQVVVFVYRRLASVSHDSPFRDRPSTLLIAQAARRGTRSSPTAAAERKRKRLHRRRHGYIVALARSRQHRSHQPVRYIETSVCILSGIAPLASSRLSTLSHRPLFKSQHLERCPAWQMWMESRSLVENTNQLGLVESQISKQVVSSFCRLDLGYVLYKN